MTRVTELTPLLKRLQLGPMAPTLPERIALARREQLDYASFLEIILSDEVNRRADRRIELRLQGAGFEETCRLEDFDWSAAISLDRRLLDAVFSLEFLAKHEHVLLVGPAGVGKRWPPALGFTAIRAGYTVLLGDHEIIGQGPGAACHKPPLSPTSGEPTAPATRPPHHRRTHDGRRRPAQRHGAKREVMMGPRKDGDWGQ